jgi:rhodanese-related sulfurtransferase
VRPRAMRAMGRRGSADVVGALLGALAIVLGSAVVGVVVNHISPRGIPVLPEPGSEELYLPPGVESLTVEEAYADFEAEKALFLDARPPEEYEEAHIPGSLNLPPTEYEEHFLDAMAEIEGSEKIVVVCSGIECADSIQVAERLLEAVEGPIYVVEDGWRAWEEAGYPMEEPDR